MHALLLSGLVLLAQGTAPPEPMVLSCSLPARLVAGAPSAAPADRIFRVAQGSFQEWDPAQRKFGGNLCSAFACRGTADRLEGSIGSASVTYTVGVLSGTKEGYWRAVGASGLTATKGPCRIITAPQP